MLLLTLRALPLRIKRIINRLLLRVRHLHLVLVLQRHVFLLVLGYLVVLSLNRKLISRVA